MNLSLLLLLMVMPQSLLVPQRSLLCRLDLNGFIDKGMTHILPTLIDPSLSKKRNDGLPDALVSPMMSKVIDPSNREMLR